MKYDREVFLVAEIGSVHDGSIGNAKALINMCANAGVDAVKFQTHIAHAETIRNAPTPPGFTGEPRYSYFERTGFTADEWRALYEHCQEQSIEFMSAPFSEKAVDLLERVGVCRYKIPSGEVTNLPMIQKIAKTKKPVVLSTGMSFLSEVDEAVDALKDSCNSLTILQCTSAYPCSYAQVGINVLAELRARYQCQVGLSDHTPTNYASFAAVSLGATYIEKHVTFSREMYGSDAANAIEPHELRDLVSGVRAIEEMRQNQQTKEEITREIESIKPIFEKSVVALSPIVKGDEITRENIGLKKPGTGLHPRNFEKILGTRALIDVEADSVIPGECVNT
jgi:N,N'-diacetyllegionaminate synthase